MGDAVSANGAATHQQVLDALGQHGAVGHVHVTAGGGQNQYAVAVDELGVNAHRVVKARLVPHVLLGHVVDRVDLARVADADGHAKVAQPHPGAAGRVAAQRLNGQHGLLAPFDLEVGQAVGVGAVAAGQVHQVHVGQLAGVVHRAPGAGNGVQVRRDHAVADGLGKGFGQKGRKHGVFLARGLDLPLAGGPVAVGLRVGAHPGHESLLVHPRQVKHHRRRLHVLHRRLDGGRTGAVGNIGVPRGVNHAFGKNGLAPGFGLNNDAGDGVAVHDGGHKQPVQHGVDAGLLHQPVCHQLEAL